MIIPLNNTILDTISKNCNNYNLLLLGVLKKGQLIISAIGNCVTVLTRTNDVNHGNENLGLYWYRIPD